MHVVGDQAALQPLDGGEHRIGHGHTVGAGFLGHRDGDGGRAERGKLLLFGMRLIAFAVMPVGRAGVVIHHRGGVVGALGHQRDVADIGRLAEADTDHQVLDVARGAQERAGVEGERTLSRLDHADATLGIGRGDGLGDLVEPDAEAGEALGKDLDLDRVGPSAGDEALRGVGHLLETLHHVEAQRAQRAFVDLVAPQRERDHRHVVDALGLDERHAHARRDLVEVGLDLVVELDQRRAHLLADLELHGHHGAVAFGGGVDVLDAGDLAHQPLERVGGERGHLLGGDAGILEEHVDHRHRDLRIFLPRREDQAHDAEPEAGEQEQRRQRRIDEGLREAAGKPEIVFVAVTVA